MGRAAMLWLSKSHTGSRQAHEHYRTWPGLSAIAASVGGAVGVGLEAVSDVREPADDQERRLPAAALDFSRPRAGAGATPSVPGLRQVVRGAIGATGTRQLVRPGGPPQCGRSLATWAHVVAAHGGVSALVAGTPRTLAHVAAGGSAAAGRS